MNISIESIDHIISSLEEGLYFTDRDRNITYWNRSAELISGYKAEEVVGTKCSDNILVHVDKTGKCLCLGNCPLAQTMADGCPRCSEVYLHHKDGHRVPVSVRVNTLTDAEGNVVGGVELFTDLSTEKAYEKRIKKLSELALLDNLTKLVNRHYLNSELSSSFDKMRLSGVSFGIIYLDIDFFKKINDVYGHGTGDDILKMVGKNLKSSGRAFDIFGRWGGEEFLGIIPNVSEKELGSIAERVRIKIKNSFIYSDKEKIAVTVSIGAAVAKKEDSVESLLNRVDSLLYRSKNSGRDRVNL